MGEKVSLIYKDKTYEYPVITGTENEKAFDTSCLRKETGLITMDYGYQNTGSTKSSITFVNGEEGILRYRGYPIEELAEKATFPETAWLLIYGELPCNIE
jgi:citrate synthase